MSAHAPMKWWHYRQNNSGGKWKPPALSVFVEAPVENVANALAEMHGVYFGGGGDCRCCGDRWSMPWDDGDEVPTIRGEPVTAAALKGEPPWASLYEGQVKAVFIRCDGTISSTHPITGEDCS